MRNQCTGFVAGSATPLARSSFQGGAVCHAPARQAIASSRAPARISMRSDANLATKVRKVESVREALAESEFVFQAPLPGISMSQITELKKSLPEGSVCRTVKNTLMKRALEGTPWVVLGDLCKESSVWFFVSKDIKGTVTAYTKFAKEHSRGPVLGGCLEETLYDADGVKAISELPTKEEIYTQIAVLLKVLPTKVAKTVKAVPTKLARAIKLAVADEEAAPAEA